LVNAAVTSHGGGAKRQIIAQETRRAMLSLAGVARRSKQLHKDWLTFAVSFALPTNQIENINTLIQF